MAFKQGIDFRATAGFVSDPTDCTSEIGTTANYPRATPQGNNVGWEQAPAGTRNRSATVDARLAGIAFVNAGPKNYRIDLPASGWYKITLAIGDATSAQSQQLVTVLDDTTVISNVVMNPGSALGQFYDACGVEYTAANWPTKQVSFVAFFSSGICRIRLGAAGSTVSSIAHITVEDATAPTLNAAAGVDFRATSPFVTDPSGDSPEISTGADYPHITQQGYTVGWEQAPSGTRDRSAAVDARLAGMHFVNNGGSAANFRIDLPAVGDYRIALAIGDASGANHNTVELFDDATSLGAVVTNGANAGGQFYDASGVLRTSSADWVTNEVEVAETFASTILRIKVGDPSAAGASCLAHIRVTKGLNPSFAGKGTLAATVPGYQRLAPAISGKGSLAATVTATSGGIQSITPTLSGSSTLAASLVRYARLVVALAGTSSFRAQLPVILTASGEMTLTADVPTVYLIAAAQGQLILTADPPTLPGPIQTDSGTMKLAADPPTVGSVQPTIAGVIRLAADPPRIAASVKPISGKLLLKADPPAMPGPVQPDSGKLILRGDPPALAGPVKPTSGRIRLKADAPTVYPVLLPASGRVFLRADPPTAFGAAALRLAGSGIIRLRADVPVIPNLKEPTPPPPEGIGISTAAVVG